MSVEGDDVAMEVMVRGAVYLLWVLVFLTALADCEHEDAPIEQRSGVAYAAD